MMSAYASKKASKKEKDAARYKASPAAMATNERRMLEGGPLQKKLGCGLPSSNKEERRLYDAARYDAKAAKSAYDAKADAKVVLFRANQLAGGVTPEELGPTFAEITEEIDGRFVWGDGRVNITDVDGKVWVFEDPRWHRTYIALDEPRRIVQESCGPFRTSHGREPWLVQTKVDNGVHPKIGKSFLEGLLQSRVKIYNSADRATTRLAENAVGRNAKEGGWVSTACNDGSFLSFSSICCELWDTRSDVIGVLSRWSWS